MKNWKQGFIGIVVIMVLAFTACNNDNDDPTTYTVTFDADNGTPNTTQTVTAGGKATQPTAPTKSGYTFAHWNNIADNAQWDFNTPITANITLKAQWTEDPNVARQQTATRELTYGLGTITIEGFMTNTQWDGIADKIVGNLNAYFEERFGDGEASNAFKTLFGRELIYIVEPYPEGYNNIKTTGDGKTAYIALDKVDTAYVIDTVILLYSNETYIS